VTVASVETPAGAQRPTMPTLKVRTMPYLSYAPFHMAQQQGLFARQGVNVELIDMDASAPVIPALARGDLDVLPAVISPAIFNAIARGGDIRLVASISELVTGGCTTTALVANRAVADSGRLSRADGWKGLRIAGARAPFSQFLLDKILQPLGMSADALQSIDVPEPLEGDTIRAGRADVGLMTEPWLTRALAANEVVVWKPMQDVAPGFQYTVLLYGPTLLKTHPELGQKFMVALLEAIRQFGAGKTPLTLDIVGTATRLDRDLLSRACWPGLRAGAEVNTGGALEFQVWARKRGLVDQLLPLTAFHDASFTAFAQKIVPARQQ
jgi:NitT/TauT family transport system substrate-binding protein